MIQSYLLKPDLFDVVELLVELPDLGLRPGDRGAIVENYDDRAYEIEFVNPQGETLAMVALRPNQFMVVWQSTSQTWVSLADRLAALIQALPEESQEQVLNFARSLCQSAA